MKRLSRKVKAIAIRTLYRNQYILITKMKTAEYHAKADLRCFSNSFAIYNYLGTVNTSLAKLKLSFYLRRMTKYASMWNKIF